MKIDSLIFDLNFNGLDIRNARIDYLVDLGVPAETILDLVKGRLMTAVDDKAEAIRSQFVTPGAGQAMEYREAQTEAFAALKAPAKATSEIHPMLAASIGIDVDPSTGAPATDVLGVARAVNASYELWRTVGAAIRVARLTGKQAIKAAESPEAAAEAYDAVSWPART